MNVHSPTLDSVGTRRGESLGAAIFASLLGAFILFGVGFSQLAPLHDGAHDSRHAFAFPCH